MKSIGSPALPGARPLAWADVSAATLAGLCLLHCLALPLLIPLLPLAGHFAGSEAVHRVLVWLAAPVSLTVLLTTLVTRPPARSVALAMALASGLCMLIAAVTEPFAAYERPLTVAGSLTLAAAHLWNWRRALA